MDTATEALPYKPKRKALVARIRELEGLFDELSKENYVLTLAADKQRVLDRERLSSIRKLVTCDDPATSRITGETGRFLLRMLDREIVDNCTREATTALEDSAREFYGAPHRDYDEVVGNPPFGVSDR